MLRRSRRSTGELRVARAPELANGAPKMLVLGVLPRNIRELLGNDGVLFMDELALYDVVT